MRAVGGKDLFEGSFALESTSDVIHIAPADQPTSVHQLTDRLFGAYTIDNGKVHLAGCQLEDQLFLRLIANCGDDLREIYLDAQCREVPSDQIAAMGMRQTVKLAKPPKDAAADIRRLAEAGTRLARQRLGLEGSSEPVQVAALWCKFAEGKLRFTFGEYSADLPFAGWTRMLAAPPFVCPYTGQTTFHLAATDDGRIAAAQHVQTCDETGQRVLVAELVTCSVTGRRVLATLGETCSLTGQPVLRRIMDQCLTCRQRVSPATIQRGQCAACRRLQRVSKADPRMARLLDEHPPLDRWRRWSLAETATVYIVVATAWFKRLLVVADKESLEIKVLATGNRLTRGWRVVDPVQYAFVLRE